MSETMTWRAGGCHCGAVRFDVQTPEAVEVEDCNCSMCGRTGFLHLIVPTSRFRLRSGEDKLTSYRFNTRTANHLFCSVCGVKSFYVPRSNPDGFSVNLRCLDDPRGFTEVKVVNFDGCGNWEEQAQALAYKSKA
jgi:hypothetical protein